MKQIMPHGYSRKQTRKRLTDELRKARASELAIASESERARIEKEIEREVGQKLQITYPSWRGPVLW